jgi:hypothetical protein
MRPVVDGLLAHRAFECDQEVGIFSARKNYGCVSVTYSAIAVALHPGIAMWLRDIAVVAMA